MIRDEEAWAQEGDPLAEWQWLTNSGLSLEWIRACKLKPKDRVLMSNRFAHTVAEAYEMPSGLWRLVLIDPVMAGYDPMTGRHRSVASVASKIGSYFPRRREWYVKPSFLFRIIVQEEQPEGTIDAVPLGRSSV